MAANLHRIAARLQTVAEATPGSPELGELLLDLEAVAAALLQHAEALSECQGLGRAGAEGATIRINTVHSNTIRINTILGRSHGRLARACASLRPLQPRPPQPDPLQPLPLRCAHADHRDH